MEFGSRLALVLGLFLFTVLLNVPFGYMRGRARSLPVKLLCIHLPIPLVFLGRLLSGLDFKYVPIFIAGAVIGQVWGGKLEL
jgi:hypothetical protein